MPIQAAGNTLQPNGISAATRSVGLVLESAAARWYACSTVEGIRPRSGTSCPLRRAHSHTAFASLCRPATAALTRLRPPTFRANGIHLSRPARRSLAFASAVSGNVLTSGGEDGAVRCVGPQPFR